jgi:hypothetical protein
VLGTNGSVTAATRSDAPGQTGVVISLNDGRTATVRFAQTGTGGTLEIRTAGGTTEASGPLPTTSHAARSVQKLTFARYPAPLSE